MQYRFLPILTDSYRILLHFTDSYRILPFLTASYRFLPIFTDSGVLLRSMGEEGTAKKRQGSSVNWEAGGELRLPTWKQAVVAVRFVAGVPVLHALVVVARFNYARAEA